MMIFFTSTVFIIIGIVLFFLIYFNLDSIVSLFDHSIKRNRWHIKPEYEDPVYLKKPYSKRWHGWDGWYALFIPNWDKEEKDMPFNIIRISIMTGLYGVSGIDNYKRLKGITRNKAGEFLGMVQTEQQSFLSQKYVNKDTEITLFKDILDVRLGGKAQLEGTWPNYRISAKKDDINLDVRIGYYSHNVSWWANIKRIFSYWSAFSSIEGVVHFKNKRYDLKGFGSFEHGWCRILPPFNGIVQFIRFFARLFHIRLIYYHYEILSIQYQYGAGTMLAGGPFGMNIRKRCETFFPNNKNESFNNTKIKYVRFKKLLNPVSNRVFNVPKKWEVSASNENGRFTYIAEAKSPPAFIASNMIYFDFSCQGCYKLRHEKEIPFKAKGYGEYVFM